MEKKTAKKTTPILQTRTRERCEKCGLRKRGPNHDQGRHHIEHARAKK